MKHYDFIIAGGGLAGLSLAYHLAHSPLRGRSILIVDKDAKNQNDRTWCFWASQPTPFDDIAYRTWKHLQFVSDDFHKVIDLGRYRYLMIRGIDFYRYTRSALSALPHVEFVEGVVEHIEDGADRAEVTVRGRTYTGAWVFDSLFEASEFKFDPSRYHYLKQHFKGWEIEMTGDAFCPQVPTLFDFRTPQDGAMRFFYVLPFSERRALVEYTLFSVDLLSHEEYERRLRDYIESRLEIRDYRIVAEENGVIPMTDHPFPRRGGQRIMNIGTKGGRVKPSSGYAFLRVQQDSAAIVRSVIRSGHPFDVPGNSAWYRLHDSIMLQVMSHEGGRMAGIFTELFKNNPVERIFRFLDESSSQLQNVALLASLPPWPFLSALFRLKVLRRI